MQRTHLDGKLLTLISNSYSFFMAHIKEYFSEFPPDLIIDTHCVMQNFFLAYCLGGFHFQIASHLLIYAFFINIAFMLSLKYVLSQ